MAAAAALLRALALTSGAGLARAASPAIGGTVGVLSPSDIPVPSGGFPADSAGASNAAWPGGKQPERLSYWPQTGFGTRVNRTLLSCWKTKVIHDFQNGWPGLCLNLIQNPDISSVEGCRNFCVGEPRCPVWQVVNQTMPLQCWVGYGTNCVARSGQEGKISVMASQRIMHGEVKVIMNLVGLQVANLYQIGTFTEGDPIERCRAWCYSTISCEYWQYSATAGGCFVDAPLFSTNSGSKPQNIVQYPLTTNGGISTNPAFTVGEYLVHYCPMIPVVTTPTPTAPPIIPLPQPPTSSSISWTTWLCWGLAACLGIAALVFYILQNQGSNRGAKARKMRSEDNMSESNMDQSYRYDEDKPLMTPKLAGQMPPGGAGGVPAPPPAPQSADDYGGYGQRAGGQGGQGGFRGASSYGPTSGYGNSGYNPSGYGGAAGGAGTGGPGGTGYGAGGAGYGGGGGAGASGAGAGYGAGSAAGGAGYGAGGGAAPGYNAGAGGGGYGGGAYGGGSQGYGAGAGAGGYGASRYGQTPGLGGAMPPPTQLVDFGQAAGMAPPQLLQPGAMQFPTPAGSFQPPPQRRMGPGTPGLM